MRKKLLLFILSFSVLTATAGLSARADDDKNDSLRQENTKDRDKIDSLNQKVDKKNTEIKASKDEIETLGIQIGDLSQKIADSESKLEKIKKDLIQNEKDLKKSIRDEEKIRKEMKLRIQYMYENSNTNLIVLMMQKESLSEFLNSAEYKSKITDYDRKKVEEYAAIVQKVRDQKAKNEQLKKDEEDTKATLEADRANCKDMVARHEKMIAVNEKDIEAMSDEIKALKEKIAEREAEIQRNIEEAAAKLRAIQNGTGLTQVTGKVSSNQPASSGFIWPLPANYTVVTSPFTKGRRLVAIDYVNGGHLGVDIGAPTGTPIYAARSGVVVWSGFDPVSGNSVTLLMDNGMKSIYAHMSRQAVSSGQTVKQGQVIGYVGMTGSATGPHLHYQVEADAKAPFGSTAFDPLTLY